MLKQAVHIATAVLSEINRMKSLQTYKYKWRVWIHVLCCNMYRRERNGNSVFMLQCQAGCRSVLPGPSSYRRPQSFALLSARKRSHLSPRSFRFKSLFVDAYKQQILIFHTSECVIFLTRERLYISPFQTERQWCSSTSVSTQRDKMT
jgi:hypothetical protein